MPEHDAPIDPPAISLGITYHADDRCDLRMQPGVSPVLVIRALSRAIDAVTESLLQRQAPQQPKVQTAGSSALRALK